MNSYLITIFLALKGTNDYLIQRVTSKKMLSSVSYDSTTENVDLSVPWTHNTKFQTQAI